MVGMFSAGSKPMRTTDCKMSDHDKPDSGSNFSNASDAPKPVEDNEDDLDYLTAD